MFVVTFYSYKGGVGRTSALVNVAYRLARRGKRVFVLDFDLEAPGIDSYGLAKNHKDTPGLVEYISAFTATGKVPNLRDFVLDSTMPGTVGKLFLMRGGRKDDDYKSALGQLDWKILYRQRRGFLLIENLKAAIDKLFRPDYLLVDARTGLTDISGICTLQLPHLVVLLFSLNEQNVSGVSTILQSIKGNKLNREIKTLLVASPVPDMPEWVEARSTRFESARKAMGSAADVVIPYDPFLAFGECIVDSQSLGPSKSRLGQAYDLLTEKIVSENSSDVFTLLSRANELIREGQHELAESHFRGVVDTMPQSVEAWMEFGKFEKLRRRLSRACEYFEKAYSLEPTDCEVLAQLTSTYAYVDKVKCERYWQEYLKLDQVALRILGVSDAIMNAGHTTLAVEGYLRSTILDDKNVGSFINLGQAHMQLHHYRQSADAYHRGLELEPNNLVCVFNVGLAYGRLDDPRATEYFSKAIEIFEQTKRPTEKIQLANIYEAMSRAYLAVGKTEKAIQLLEDAITLAKELPKTRIFLSSKYENVTQDKFISDVSLRLQNVQKKLGMLDSVKAKEGPLN
jgi:tetratricopeptide (TPR) repeat protein